MIDGGNRVLPDQRFLRHELAAIAHDRPHVAVRELEPGAGKSVRELVRMLVEAPRDLLIGRVEAQREVRGQHGRNMLLRLVIGVGDGGLGAFRFPLLRAGRALGQLPFVLEQVVEEVVAPFRRCLRPGHFRATGDGVGAEAGAILALPAEALILDRRAFRLGADQRWIAGTMGLAEGVAAGDQRHGLFVVHRHAEERFADVFGRGNRIRLAVRAFRIDVDQAHLHRAERLRQLTFAAVAFVAQPGALGTPIQLFRLPHIGAAAGEAERLEAHRFQGDVAGENHEIGPGNLAAIFLLDRPQQAARLVEVRVIRPAVERREALLTGAGAAATVGDAVGAGAVPRHADEQSAIVAEVGRPPLLRVRHQGPQVLDHGVDVEALELLGIVERFAHRIGGGRLGMEHADIEVLWPPVAIPVSAGAAGERALAGAVVSFCVHVFSPSRFCSFLRVVPYGMMMASRSCGRRDPSYLPQCGIAGAKPRRPRSALAASGSPAAGEKRAIVGFWPGSAGLVPLSPNSLDPHFGRYLT